MRIRTIKLIFLTITAATLITSCNRSSGGFETDSKTGVIYRFIKHTSGVTATDSDFAKVLLAFSTKAKDGKDSVVFDSRKRGDTSGISIPLHKTYHASLEEGIMMMSVGDSAEFQINADSLYLKYFHYPPNRIPPGVTSTTMYTFHIKLKSIMTKKDMMEEQNKQRQKMMEQMMARKSMEASSIADYLKKNSYENIKPTADSIYYLKTVKGKGPQVKEGDSIQVNYTGYLLDGTVFDKSDRGEGHSTFALKYSKDQNVIRVIQGWINVLGTMNKGEKVTVLLPSAVAYGARGMQQIQPYTPLIFDMEVVSIKPN